MKPIFFAAFFVFSLSACAFSAEQIDFRVNHTTRQGTDAKSVSDGKTVFIDGRVYDHLTAPQEVVIYEPLESRFTLLNLRTKEKVVLTTEQIDTYFEEFRQRATRHENPDIRSFADPQFQVSYREAENRYSFTSRLISYEITPQKPEKPAILQQYRQFAKAYCKLNLMLSPGAKTVFARMAVNDTIFNTGSLIARSQVTIRSPQGASTTVTSDYQFLPRLVESDRTWAQQVDGYVPTFTETTLTKYLEK